MNKDIKSNSFFDYKDGKVVSALCIFVCSFTILLFSLFLIFSLGSKFFIGAGLALGICSIVTTVLSGTLLIVMYIDWIDHV